MSGTTAFSSILVLSILFYVADSTGSTTQGTDFIKSSCTATRYPALCVHSLSVYANAINQSPRQLAQTALTVSLSHARSAASFVSKLRTKGMKPREIGAVKDCVENMGDSVDRLSRSVRELGYTGKAGSGDFAWHMSNVETWVSAALTDENTCMDGFAGTAMDGNVKGVIRKKVVNVAQITSNALALVNSFAEKNP
eukprot:TRINITY_DN1053_c0_g1_i2.p1 TRINITY_DN1053_c0_g1~~TRINITY_DN1053_c0_g1_i2.p1  ORF type:complete len:203 (+),score=0.96 TRINITY_DN1053_c0_g1_i2:23-610(+)